MTTRNERLAALRQAVEQWADREEERLEDEAEYLRSVSRGLTSSGGVGQTVTTQASELLEDEISAFLRG